MSKKTATIVSSDGVSFKVDEVCSMESGVFKLKVEYELVDPIKLTSNILSKVLHFLRTRADIRNSIAQHDNNNLFKDFHSEFMKQNHCLAMDLLRAAYILQIKSLFDLMSEAVVVDMITGKCGEEITKIFIDEFTLAEMESANKYFTWAF